MDKNQPFFDPYNFNTTMPPNPNMQVPQEMDMVQQAPNPAMYYDQQYMYYRYLNEMLDYKIKLKEYDRLSKENSK